MKATTHIQSALSATVCIVLVTLVGTLLSGCRNPAEVREHADNVAYGIVREKADGILQDPQAFSIEPPEETLRRRLMLDQRLPHSHPASLSSGDVERIPQWPEDYTPRTDTNAIPAAPIQIALLDALQIAARDSREYQAQKEEVFRAALGLDLERQAFRRTWTGVLDTLFSTTGGDDRVSGFEGSGGVGVSQKFKAGGLFALDLGVDLARLITQGGESAVGYVADATLSIPLLRGSGRFIVTEPLTQAERNVVYQLHQFARFRRTFAVNVASDYFAVLDALSQVENAHDSYQRLTIATRRAKRQAEAGRLPAIQLDQVLQDELRARNSWVSARISYERRLDAFKVSLGLPADAEINLDPAELARLRERAQPLIAPADASQDSGQGSETNPTPGPMELAPEIAVQLAIENRLDLRTQIGRVFDAQRAAAVAADQLRADLDIIGSGSAGESRSLSNAGSGDGSFHAEDGRYSLGVDLDLPFDRTSEQSAYRNSLIAFERSVRDVQELEDQIKLAVRNDLRNLEANRATVSIQAMAVIVAERRLSSTTMFLEAGRAATRDVLEAEQALVSAKNTLTSAIIDYRIGELLLQSDIGLLEITTDGLWREKIPKELITPGKNNAESFTTPTP